MSPLRKVVFVEVTDTVGTGLALSEEKWVYGHHVLTLIPVGICCFLKQSSVVKASHVPTLSNNFTIPHS